MVFNVRMHTVADKYNIPALARLAEFQLAERTNTALLSLFTPRSWDDFADAVEEMYTIAAHSKKVMQATAIRFALYNAKGLYNEDFGTRFRGMASKTPQFASELAAALVAEKLPPKKTSDSMKIRVSFFTSNHVNPQMYFEVTSNTPVRKILKDMKARRNISEDTLISLIFKGQTMRGDDTVGDYGIIKGDTIDCPDLPW